MSEALDAIGGWTIQTGCYCLACTAGCGSSWTGALRTN